MCEAIIRKSHIAWSETRQNFDICSYVCKTKMCACIVQLRSYHSLSLSQLLCSFAFLYILCQQNGLMPTSCYTPSYQYSKQTVILAIGMAIGPNLTFLLSIISLLHYKLPCFLNSDIVSKLLKTLEMFCPFTVLKGKLKKLLCKLESLKWKQYTQVIGSDQE